MVRKKYSTLTTLAFNVYGTSSFLVGNSWSLNKSQIDFQANVSPYAEHPDPPKAGVRPQISDKKMDGLPPLAGRGYTVATKSIYGSQFLNLPTRKIAEPFFYKLL